MDLCGGIFVKGREREAADAQQSPSRSVNEYIGK